MSLAYCAQQQKMELIIKWNPVITVSVCGEPWEVTCFFYPSSCLQLIELSRLFHLLDNMFRKHSDPDFEQIYLFSPCDLFSARTFLHLRRQM